MPKMSELELMKGYKRGTWVWCLECERVYKVGEYRKKDLLQLCPYGDCDAGVLDAWLWSDMVSRHGYPVEPERGKVYALYPAKR